MKSVRLHPSQLEMQNLSGVEFSDLEFDWGELQAHKNSTGVIKISTWGGTQIVYFPLGFGISRVGVTLFSLLSLGCAPMHTGAPRWQICIQNRLYSNFCDALKVIDITPASYPL